jgi:hypothetical protein
LTTARQPRWCVRSSAREPVREGDAGREAQGRAGTQAAATGKCEGRKTYAERSPQMVTLAKRLHRFTIDKRQRSLRDIAAELEAAGYTLAGGKRHTAAAISRMISA